MPGAWKMIVELFVIETGNAIFNSCKVLEEFISFISFYFSYILFNGLFFIFFANQ